MKTNMQEINEPAFHAYLKKAQSSPNTIRSCLAAYRLYHSLYNDLAVNHLLCFKDYLIRHYKASTVNNRIYGINRYLDFLEEIYGSQMIHFRLTVIRTQQAASWTISFPRKTMKHLRKDLRTAEICCGILLCGSWPVPEPGSVN